MYEELLESSEFYQKRYHNFSSRIILPTLGLLIVIIVFLVFMEREITLKSYATVEPTKILDKIQSRSNNTINKNNLKENVIVSKDDLLIEYDSDLEVIQYENIYKHLNSITQQKEQLMLLKSSVEIGSNVFPEEDSFGYYQQFKDYLNQRQIVVSDMSNQVSNSNLNNQLISLKSQKLVEICEEVTQLNQTLLEANGNLLLQKNILDAMKIKSTASGIVHLNPEVTNFNNIPEGTVIAEILPKIEDTGTVKIEFYISDKDISTIKIGDKIKFMSQDSSNRDIILKSKITHIDSLATRTEKESYFKVIADTKLNKKEIDYFKYGMSGDVIVVTGRKRYLDYYLDKFLN